MYLQDGLLDLLDRKYRLRIESPPTDFLLELESFVRFVLDDETLQSYVDQLTHEFEQRQRAYEREIDRLRLRLTPLRESFARRFPDLDDSNMEYETEAGGFPAKAYRLSLAHFDDIVNQVDRGGPKVWSQDADLYGIQPDVSSLSHILEAKLDQAPQDDVPDLYADLVNISEAQLHLHRGFVNYCRVSPIVSFLHLRFVADLINPLPQPINTPQDLMDAAIGSVVSAKGRLQTEVHEVACGGKENAALIDQLKTHLRRAYEGIRAAIGSRLRHYEILQRYKARCMWYDRERLGQLIVNSKGKEEDVLTRDLALYLFDNGMSTLYRVRKGVHEYDLIAYRTKRRVFVEAKVYKSSDHARRDLVQGFAQLHAYLNALEADDLPVQEVYYVIYRLGGPLYDLPCEIPTNRRTFYPMIVDLGPSEASGSKQPKPISIDLTEFFAEIQGPVGSDPPTSADMPQQSSTN